MNMQGRAHELRLCIDQEKNTDYLSSSNLCEQYCQEINSSIEKNLQKEFYLDLLKELIDISIIISSYPKRIIRKGTSKQSGIQIDTTLKCLLKPGHVTFENVVITPYMYTPDTNGKRVVKSKLIYNKIESNKHENIWVLKKMKYKSEESARLSRNSTCEKRVILFEFSAVGHTEYLSTHVHKELISDTIVTICHSHQEIDSQITLFLDDYYRKDRRHGHRNELNFECFDSSGLIELVENLSDLFQKESKRALTESNKYFLLEKMQSMFPVDLIRLDDFVKRCMPKSKFSFAKWIMLVIKMLKIPTLESMWQNDLIEGFISKNVQNVLMDPNSFLLRFSERKPAIGVVKLSINSQNTDVVVEAWEPYSENHLRNNNLANLLDGFSCLKSIRKANGDLVQCCSALPPFLDPEIIDVGYTPRGGNWSVNSGDHDNGSSNTNDTSLGLVDFDNNNVCSPNYEDWDLNEIFQAANMLLNGSNSNQLTGS